MTAAIASIQIDHQRFEALLKCFDSAVDEMAGGAPAEANIDLVRSIVDYVHS